MQRQARRSAWIYQAAYLPFLEMIIKAKRTSSAPVKLKVLKRSPTKNMPSIAAVKGSARAIVTAVATGTKAKPLVNKV